jgi:hypothetical protein
MNLKLNPKYESLGGAVPLTNAGNSGLIEHGFSLQSDPIETLIEGTLNRLVKRLENFGNTVSKQHRQALREVVTAYAKISNGQESGRWAFPLAPGVGKTQSVVAFITESWRQGYFSVYTANTRDGSTFHDIDAHFSIAVAANKIEALCEIKRDLVEAGVPGELIGLRHSYQHNRAKAERFLEGHLSELPDGYASEPCTEDAFSKPILLCSHSLIHNRKGSLESFFSFDGKPRSLLIWDESLLAAQAKNVSKLQLEDELAAMKVRQQNQLGDYAFVIESLEAVGGLLRSRLKHQEEGSPMWEVTLQEHLGPAMKLYNMLPDAYRYEGAKLLFDLSDEALKVAEVYGQDKAAFIHSELVVPKELENIVVLDASAPIRKLMEADKSIRTVGSTGMDLVSYEDVVIRQLQWNSGRTSMDRVARRSGTEPRAIFKDIIEVVKSIPDDEGILFFTFKPRYSHEFRSMVNFEKKLAETLDSMDLKDTIEVWDPKSGELVKKDRFNFLTFGNETSTSKFAFCKNVVFCGVLWRTPADIVAHTYGQTESDVVLGKQLLKQVALTEKAYIFHQGLFRSQCRFIDKVNTEGKPTAKAANIWMIYRDEMQAEPMRNILRKVMPGVRWEEWKPVHYKDSSKLNGLGEKIVDWLNQQPDLERISTKKLKQEMALQDIPKDSFTKAVKRIDTEPRTGWILEGRSLVRDDYGFTKQ